MSHVIPIEAREIISYRDPDNLDPRASYGRWRILKSPIESVQQMLRNSFFLPLHKKKSLELENNNTVARDISNHLLCPTSLCSDRELQAIRNHFTTRDIDVQLEGPIVRIFTVRLFESKVPIAGKKLRVILFVFNGNKEKEGSSERDWNPLRIDELSKSPLSVLKAFLSVGIRVHSLITNSVGNVVLDALPIKATDSDNIPDTLIINRGLSSVRKVTNRLFWFPKSYFFYQLAKLFKWNADPETGLLNFIKNNKKTINNALIIETPKDFHFSEQAALDKDLHDKIFALGSRVFRATFWPYPFQNKSHHAITLDHLKKNPVVNILGNTMSFKLNNDEDMASAIVRNVFLDGDGEWHTCFVIGGSDATPDIGTAREVKPLLAAFVEQGEIKAQSQQNAG